MVTWVFRSTETVGLYSPALWVGNTGTLKWYLFSRGAAHQSGNRKSLYRFMGYIPGPVHPAEGKAQGETIESRRPAGQPYCVGNPGKD